MSIVDANIKTSTCEKQFFQTLPEQVNALASFLEKRYHKGISILDAGSGEGRIVNGLKSNGFENIKTNDLYFDADFKGDFLKYPFKNTEFDLVVSNPPYISRDKKKYKFIDKALNIAESAFFMFPLQMLNYIYFCEKYLDTDKYGGRITMYPKMILNSEGIIKQGGNTGYGWFWFSHEFSNNKFEKFIDTRQFRE